MCTWLRACLTIFHLDAMPTEDNCLLFREFHARVVLVDALQEQMMERLDPTDDAGRTQWKAISEMIDACAKQIDDEELKNPVPAIVLKRVISVSSALDERLLGCLRTEHDLSQSLKDYLPDEDQTWQSFLDSKPNLMGKCEDNSMPDQGLKYLRIFQTLAKSFKQEIDNMVSDSTESQSMEMPNLEIVFYATDRREFDGIWNEHNLFYGTKKELRVQGHVLLYIHGFKTSLNRAVRRAAQLKHDLKFKGVVIAYCWPSEGTHWGYDKDGHAVDDTADNLRQVITTLLSEKGISQVHILAHSMGNRALIKALTDAATKRKLDQGKTKAKETPGEGEGLRNVILAAADAQRCKFEAMLQVMYPKDQSAEGKVPQRPIISVYSSAGDGALWLSKWYNREIRLGNTYSLLEMKEWENEVDVVDATGERCAGSRHSYHAEVYDVLNDIQELLTNSRRAKESEVRRSIIKEVTSEGKITFHAFDKDWWTPERLTQAPCMVGW